MTKNKKNLFEKKRSIYKRMCYMEKCVKPGIYKAPKSKDDLKEYLWFCEDHIKEYNKKWNYCKNMTQREIEEHIRLDTIGWRPTWNFSTRNTKFKKFEEMFKDYFSFFKKKKKNKFNLKKGSLKNAFEILNIKYEEKLDIKLLENNYKILVKKYHPDKNKGNKKYEEKLKEINHAFEEIKKHLTAKLN